MVGANRAFNILHSLDQVLFGWMIGIWVTFSFLHILKLLLPQIPSPSFFAFLSLATFLCLTALYLSLATSSDPYPDSWSTFLSINCSHPHLEAHTFEDKSYRTSLKHFFALGAYLGLANV
jgi:hypothetical protein